MVSKTSASLLPAWGCPSRFAASALQCLRLALSDLCLFLWIPQIFGSAGLAYATAALTVTTLFFGELLPKALGVNNAEVVARRVLPIIIILSVVLNPVAKTFTLISSVGRSYKLQPL